VGKGSTFHFTMSFAPAKGAAALPPAGIEQLKDVPVLIVDDNATNRRILEAMLQKWYMVPVAVPGGEQALSLLEEATRSGHPFRMIIVDGQMPVMDGFMLVERIRASQSIARATILMLTSAGGPGDVARCRELGIETYLLKPVRQSELLDAFLRLLGQQAASAPVSSLKRASEENSIPPSNILLAEDNLTNQKLAHRLLTKQGHTVTIVNNGQEAIDILAQRSFDFVLMDVQMPQMDGLAATGVIRAREKTTGAHLPIIAMTAHAMQGDKDRCLAAGMDAYVSKPIRVPELMAAIARVVGSATREAL
jgi:CheY-like chemotaxis protein